MHRLAWFGRVCAGWLALSLLMLGSACTVGPDFSRPPAPTPSGYLRDAQPSTVAA